jgi:hypothetical protein
MWKHSAHVGSAVAFSEIRPEDDYLHPVAPDAPFTSIETNLYGFNIPYEDIQCNIYLLWHPVLKTMSAHLFVYRGERILHHQLAADYFVEHQYLPAVDDIRDYRLQMGTCAMRLKIDRPLDRILIEVDDPPRDFALRLNYEAALPPVGRPGGKHFTQLMKTRGELLLDAKRYPIDGFYVRDRSWGYQRPEQPERTPPYRWMTGWFGADSGFVVAWLDTGLIDGDEFGPHWNQRVDGPDGKGINKWESGGPTPGLNLRSGWFAVNGEPRPVVRIDVRTQLALDSLVVKAIEMDIEDDRGEVHRVVGETASMIPKMYWQNLLVHMHCMRLRYDGRRGEGDLMDTYSNFHIRKVHAR